MSQSGQDHVKVEASEGKDRYYHNRVTLALHAFT